MTMHVLSAGDGYTYYTSEVATGDRKRGRGAEIGDYYTADGNPPGVWMGGGLQFLGVSGEVTEAQMKALFGEGLHPDADRIIAERIAAGDTAEQAQKAARLGRPFYAYQQKDNELLGKIRDANEAFERRMKRAPSAKERQQIRARIGAVAFAKAKGRQPASKEELGKFITAATRPAQQAVSGFDQVMSPPKSVSVVWALASAADRKLIEDAQDRAIEDTIEFLQREAIATRVGTNGVRQTDVQGGLNATRFRHFDSRTGDPQLHDHLVVANKVFGQNGSWLSVDSRLLHKMAVAASEHYNRSVMTEVSKVLDVALEAREVTPGKRPVLEIAGVKQELIDLFSTRSSDIRKAAKELQKQYRVEHGRTPGPKAAVQLAQQATLETRPAKPKHEPLRDKLRGFRDRAATVIGRRGVRNHLDDVRAAGKNIDRSEQAAPVDVDQVAKHVLQVVSEHRSVFHRSHLLAEAERWVGEHRREVANPDALVERITAAAATREAVNITPPDVHQFTELARTDGASFYRHRNAELYTSRAVLDAETGLLQAAQTVTTAPATAAQFNAVLAAHTGPLDAGQVALARAFVTSPQALKVGIGPAGAGKTTAMRVAVHTVQHAGKTVIGLAPSAAAAKIMRTEIGVHATTIHALTAAISRGKGPNISPGDMVLIDEAGMAGTVRLHQVVQYVTDRGGVVRPIGDYRQADSVEAGGALRLLDTETDSVHLDVVHRFSNPEEAQASLLLRDPTLTGDPFAWYLENGRVRAGTPEELQNEQFRDWRADVDAGRSALMMVPTNEQMVLLNEKAQAHRLLTGHVTGRRSAPLRDGTKAYAGDLVMTRKNTGEIRYGTHRESVMNGDLWEVVKPNRDGSLHVRHQESGATALLPAGYVTAHTHLGYAATVSRGQGATVDAGRPYVKAGMTRNDAYAGLTRGRFENVLYVETEPGQSASDVLTQIAENYDNVLSAHETIRAEHDRVNDLGTLVDQYADITGEADAIRFRAALAAGLGEQTVADLERDDAWPAVIAAVRHGERVGMEPADLVRRAWDEREFQTADDIPAALSWRIERRITEYVDQLPYAPDQLAHSDAHGVLHPVPTWIADRGALDAPSTPEPLRAHLQERYDYLQLRLDERGTGIAANPPAWAASLGPVPDHGPRRDAWTQLAAEISVFRHRYNIPDHSPAAVPAPHRDQSLGADLAARITAMHKAAMLTTTPDAIPARLRAEHAVAAQAAAHRRGNIVATTAHKTTRHNDHVDRTTAGQMAAAQPTESPMMRAARAATQVASVRPRAGAPMPDSPAAIAAQHAAAAQARRSQHDLEQQAAARRAQQQQQRTETRNAGLATIRSPRDRQALTAAGIRPDTVRDLPQRLDAAAPRHEDATLTAERDSAREL